MTQILLIRHAVNDFVKSGRLAGWLPDVHLNEEGRAQAEALGQRLSSAPLDQLYASPLERTQETAEAVRQHHPQLSVQPLAAIGEIRFGDWEGQELRVLSTRKQWKIVQEYPSRMTFPNGESFRAAQARAVNAIEALATAHPRQMVAVVSHADIIKLVLAHYLGMPLDSFQRIVVSPASLSVLALGKGSPAVATMNDVAHLIERERAQLANR